MHFSKLTFSSLTGCGVKVAIVDSGIDPSHPGVGPVAGGVAISAAPGERAAIGTESTDRAGHGTACAGIIRRKAPEAELYSVKIFDADLRTDGGTLIAAIRWAVAQGMDVVNLSLGTTDAAFREPLAEACREAAGAGLILVAAEHNGGLESHPACLPDVIGVAWGRIYDRYGYYYRPGATIECIARGDEQRLCWLNGREIMMGGTSFAAPHIAGIVALIRQACPGATLEEVRETLRANALEGPPPLVAAPSKPAATNLTTRPETRGRSKYGWIKKAALYPYNKEMHALVRFRDLLGFDIVGIADPVGKRLVGKDAGEAIGILPSGIRIRPRLEDALRPADTLILGYVDRLARIARRDLLRESIERALRAGVHVFSLLPVPPETCGDLYKRAGEKGLRIAYPDIPPGDVEAAIRARLHIGVVDVPVLGVYGTSSSQGKFTLQLALRQKLIRMGYRVGQIGAEHHAELFGMDLAFPMGYASPLKLPREAYIPYLDSKMREICRTGHPDIILTGSQSGTVPYDIYEHSMHTLSSIAFLLGTKPDACILVVNSIDPDAYIRDSIDGLRAIGKAPTILLAMSDREKHIRSIYGRSIVTPRRMPRQEIERKLRRLEMTFDLPAVEIASETGRQRAVEVVLDYFSYDTPMQEEKPLQPQQA